MNLIIKNKFKLILINFSKIKFFRIISPFLNNCYDAYAVGDLTKRQIVSNQLLGWYRNIFFLMFAPRKFTGGLVLNLLGLQILRYYFYNLRYLLRPKREGFNFQCAQDGMIIKKNLIDVNGIQKILKFFEKYKTIAQHHFSDFSELVISNTNGVHTKNNSFQEIVDYILLEKKIKKIGENLTKKKINISPYISILHYKSYTTQTNQSDGQDIPHSDVFYPSYKIFVYLNNVTDENGAFRYLIGSHKFKFSNAIKQYRESVNYYKKDITEKSLKPIKASENYSEHWKSASGQPGDAVIFNAQGIHRRGNFLKDQYRERLVLLIDFRQVETAFQKLAANV
jgi:hypothetical protein